MWRKLSALLISSLISLALTGCAVRSPSAPNSNSAHLNIFSFLLDEDLWQNMGDNMSLIPYPFPPALTRQVRWFDAHKLYITQLATNASPYIYYVYQQTQKRHMPAEIALMPMIESAYNPFDYSRAGAMGLWQMMPGTAYGFGLKINWWYDGRRDIIDSTNAALNYLQYLHTFFNGHWLLAIAAYDSGEGTVQQAVEHNRKLGLATDFWALSLPRETEQYVPKLLALAVIFSNPSDHHITLPQVPNQPYFGIVPMNSQIDIATISRLAHVPLSVVRALNPSFRRWATTPHAHYHILLPIKKVALFTANLARLPKSDRVTWLHHIVQPGQTLDTIAKQYKTSVPILMTVNGLKSSLIHIHQDLLVPLTAHGHFTRKYLNSYNSIAENRLPGPQQFVYTVKPSDTLWTVAERFSVYTRQIAFWNHLSIHSPLTPGQKLVLWMPPRSYLTTAYHKHKVIAGDSLLKLAHAYHVSVTAIKTANHMHNDLIRLGQILKIPYRTYRHADHHYHNSMVIHHVRPGETIDSLARHYGVNPSDLIRWNQLAHQKYLRVGERLVIYQ